VTENVPAILLVENNKHDVEFMLKALEKYNLTDNIKVFHDRKVDGLHVLQSIMVSENTRMIPVVVFSSSTEDRNRIASVGLTARNGRRGG
jgi:hypothetical protein